MAVNLCGLLRSSLALGTLGRCARVVSGLAITVAVAGASTVAAVAIKMAMNWVRFGVTYIQRLAPGFS